MTWKPDLVLYHGGCNDGFGAAWAAFQRWCVEPGKPVNATDHSDIAGVEFRGINYGEPPAPFLTNRHVLMVDVTYTAPQLTYLSDKVASMIILDHHLTARAALTKWQAPGNTAGLTSENAEMFIKDARHINGAPIVAHFDMQKSGARLAWEFCFAGERGLPLILEYVEDHDLWRHVMFQSQDFAAALGSYPHEFDVWSTLDRKAPSLAAEGWHILRNERKMLRELLPYRVSVRIGGHAVPALNVPFQLASLGGHALLEAYPDEPFAATWFNRGDRDQWSLRSQDHRENVGEIAKLYDGGGHRNAAGFHAEAGRIMSGKPALMPAGSNAA